MIRMIAAVRAAVAATAWLVGLPGLLVVLGGSPIPASPPSAVSVQAWLDNPFLPQYAPGTVKTTAWLIWALTALTILTVWVRRARRWQWARLTAYLPGPVQGLAATLLGAAAATTTATAGVPAAYAAAPATTTDTPAPGHTGTSNDAAQTGAATRADTMDRPQVHQVKQGDTLWDIAGDTLGDPQRWRDIYRLNRGVEQPDGSTLTRPGKIQIGWTLTLPPAAPGTPPQQPDTAPEPAQEESASPITPASSSPSAQAPNSASPAEAATPGSDQASRCSDTPADTARPSDGPGVDLPGGWITLGLGGGLLAAVAMVWRRRRHRYRPTPIISPRLNDPDLLPPLAAMTRIRTSLRRAAPETLDQAPAPAPTVREYRAAVVKPELPPVGPSGSDLAGAAALPLSTGLGLTGDGALDAARGLLVATLASGSGDDPDAKGRVIIPAATMATLLSVSAVDLGHLDRLTVTATVADAITQLEEEIIRRSRLIADAQAADVQTLRDNDFHAEPLPQLLLIAEVLDPAWTNRLVTAVWLGHSVDIGAAVIGDWPTGTTLTVAADGTTGIADAPRLAVLDTAAAIEMLGVLREAHGDSDSPARVEPPERPHPPAPAPVEPDVAVERDTEPVDDTPAPATAAPAATARRLPVAVRVLGRPAVLDHDGQPSPGIRSKAIELLVYLAVNRQGADLSDIMEALYPDANMRRAGERLSTVVADLRKHIRQAAATPADTEQPRKQRLEPIPNTGSRYHLDPAVVRVDWWTVLDHYGATATATDEQRLSRLTAAIEAAGGALAEGVEYDWIDTDREVVRRHRIKLHAHAAALLADTDPYQSWLLLEQACQIDPLSDELARTTMRAAAALGDADAIRHRLKTLRDALDAHGLELSDETEALARELLRQLHPPRPSE